MNQKTQDQPKQATAGKQEASDFKEVLSKPSLLSNIASDYGQSEEEYRKALLATALKPPKPKQGDPIPFSSGEVQAFLTVARRYGLDPLAKEIYCSRDKWNKLLIVVGVDGWIKIMNSRPEFDGIEFEMVEDKKGDPHSVIATIFRKDRSRPYKITEYFSECNQKIGAWLSHPRRFLRHKGLIQCTRYAFGISGIMDEDEARLARDGITEAAASSMPADQLSDLEERLKAKIKQNSPPEAAESK